MTGRLSLGASRGVGMAQNEKLVLKPLAGHSVTQGELDSGWAPSERAVWYGQLWRAHASAVGAAVRELGLAAARRASTPTVQGDQRKHEILSENVRLSHPRACWLGSFLR